MTSAGKEPEQQYVIYSEQDGAGPIPPSRLEG
jgi:hypothetical protein